MPKINVLDMYAFDGRPDAPDFGAMRQRGVVGIIHCATQGGSYVDPKFASREALARAAGMLWGGYHVLTSANVFTQADLFLKTLDMSKPVCMVVDYSNLGDDAPALHQLYTFCSRVDSNSPPELRIVVRGGDHLRKTLFKTSGGFNSPQMSGYEFFFKGHRLWLTEEYSEQSPWPWETVFMRQYVAPYRDPVIGKIGQCYTGNLAELPNNWSA